MGSVRGPNGRHVLGCGESKRGCPDETGTRGLCLKSTFTLDRSPDQPRIAIQGELGSNSHIAALQVFGTSIELALCSVSAEVFEQLESETADAAVLPIENSLHGSVFEHYDLLLRHPVTIVGETMLRIRHNLIAAPGVCLEQIRQVRSHPVALSQCRQWLLGHREIEAVPFYDTAGAVKQLIADGRRDVAGIAPAIAAEEYGAEVIVADIQDHADNYTRFYTLVHSRNPPQPRQPADKASLAFSLEHRPGSLIEALEILQRAGLNLTKIESRPVQGRPWEYIFFVDVAFAEEAQLDSALAGLTAGSEMVRELGRYRAAV